MLRSTPTCLRGHYVDRLKTRMVGYVPKVVPRKIKGALVSLRSEANTGYYEGHIKSASERQEAAGKKLAKVIYDPIVGRNVVAREAKLKAVVLVKNQIQKKVTTPF
jgi:hypothetical protein